jgi:hypothetical protein
MGLHPIHYIILKPTQSQVCLCHHRLNHTISSLPQLEENLVECARPGAPVGEEHAETNGFEDAGESADGDRVEGTLFGNDLRDDLFHRLVVCSLIRHVQLNQAFN